MKNATYPIVLPASYVLWGLFNVHTYPYPKPTLTLNLPLKQYKYIIGSTI